ncbi:cysteine desulfurase [Candidatus Saccharibacteria bacterium]|nr:MAG: cysteine desulfurase [Candidatus Saccharibacteria bacterium]
MIYLDHAAATPVDPEVLAAMQPFFGVDFYNPSATYAPARAVRQQLEAARASVAAVLGTRPSEIIFTAGGTESDNLAIAGVLQQYPDANVVVSAIEHDAVLAPAAQFNCRVALPNEQGIISPEAVLDQVDDNTVLVSVMYANNEIGTIQPIRRIAQALDQVRAERRAKGNDLPLYLHTDACQAVNYLDLHVSRLGVDLMTLNGGKIYGPKQSGVLYAGSHVRLQPIIRGGGQERNLRSGTENVAAAVGFAKALELAQAARHTEVKRLSELQNQAFKLIAEKMPEAVVNGSTKHRLPNNIHLTLRGQDNERLLVELELQGVLAAAGSACSASSDEPSHVLRALGCSDADAQSSLRLTMGRETSLEEVQKTIEILANLTK